MRARAIIVSLGLALPALALAGQVASGCFFSSAEDGALTLCFGCKRTASTGPAGTGGTGGTISTGGMSSSSTSGTGGMPQCKSATTCPAVPPGPCATFGTVTCVKGKCGVSYTTGDAPSQKYGSCETNFCDASGALTQIIDDTKLYDDGNQCTKKSCTMGVPGQVVPLTGSMCTAMAMSGYCEPDPASGVSACLQCDPLNPITTCAGVPGTTCVQGLCVPAHCTNNAKDMGETDIDCGGGATSGCLACGTNKLCSSYLDCLSQVCIAGKCAAATCSDNVQNQDETDKDCGGKTCGMPCVDGLKCRLPTDCQSGVCAPPMPANGMPNTCQAPTCTDGVQNGDETGVDCGGVMSKCPPCAP